MNFLLQTVLSARYDLIAVSDVFQGLNELKRKSEIELIIIMLTTLILEFYSII